MMQWVNSKVTEAFYGSLLMLVAILFVAGLNFSRGRLGFTQGLVHLTLFLGWLAVMFDPPPVR